VGAGRCGQFGPVQADHSDRVRGDDGQGGRWSRMWRNSATGHLGSEVPQQEAKQRSTAIGTFVSRITSENRGSGVCAT
jgi:hypothetical protein